MKEKPDKSVKRFDLLEKRALLIEAQIDRREKRLKKIRDEQELLIGGWRHQ